MVEEMVTERAGVARVALLIRLREEALALRRHLENWLAQGAEEAHEEVVAGVFSCMGRMEELRGHLDTLSPPEGGEYEQALSLLHELQELQQQNERLLANIKEKLVRQLLEIRKARQLGAYLRESYYNKESLLDKKG